MELWGCVRREGGQLVPTVTGLLLLGSEVVIRERLPTHKVAFQVLEGAQVRVNDFYRAPLLKTFERVIEQFAARLEEDEVQVGLFRVPIPTFDERAFREAFVNGIVHRDYTRLGAVPVSRETDGFIISNPDGFVEGVTLGNHSFPTHDLGRGKAHRRAHAAGFIDRAVAVKR